MVPSMYSLMWAAELVTVRWGPKTSNPHLEATARRYHVSQEQNVEKKMFVVLTEKLIAGTVLLNEFSQQLLIFTSLVGNLYRKVIKINFLYFSKSTYRSVPKCTAELDSFQKNRLGLCKIEICPHGGIKSHSAKAGNGNLLAAKWKCRNHGIWKTYSMVNVIILPLDMTNKLWS